MKKLIYLILLLPLLSYGQQKIFEVPFITGNDSILTTSSDSIDIQFGVEGLEWGVWEPLTKVLCANDTVYITLDDKSGERTKIYYLSDEAFWTWTQMIRIRIRGASDTLTSKVMTIGGSEGAVTLFVQPDSVGHTALDTILYKVRLGGR
jgi:hypothetical protein